MAILIGANPLCWMNSDIPSLGSHIPIEQCLSEIALIGYHGVELEDPLREALKNNPEILSQRNIKLIGGWHSTFLLENKIEEELIRFRKHLEFLKSHKSSLAIIGECSFSVHRNFEIPLFQRPKMNQKQWQRLCVGLNSLVACARDNGMDVVYHHHMGTVIQTEDEIDHLMSDTKDLGLLFDTGHLIYAGISPQSIIDKHFLRIRHCHLKNVRFPVLNRVIQEKRSFPEAILEGVFTVSGDNGYDNDHGFDFFSIVRTLVEKKYHGWIIMEAEQDPALANPLDYASLGYHHLNYLLSKSLLTVKGKYNASSKRKECCTVIH